MKNINTNLRILFSFVFIVMVITIYYFMKLPSRVDKILLGISIIGQISTLLGCYIQNKYITEIGHCLFGLVVLAISLVGVSKQILLINICLLLLTLFSRKYLKNCMFNYDKGDVSITQLYPDLPWDYVYLSFLIISMIRLKSRIE